jgi:hypothetical protein
MNSCCHLAKMEDYTASMLFHSETAGPRWHRIPLVPICLTDEQRIILLYLSTLRRMGVVNPKNRLAFYVQHSKERRGKTDQREVRERSSEHM